MAKDRHKNLELPLPGNAKAAPAPARRKATTARARTSRRELLLFVYQTWLTLTAGVAKDAAAGEPSRPAPGSSPDPRRPAQSSATLHVRRIQRGLKVTQHLASRHDVSLATLPL